MASHRVVNIFCKIYNPETIKEDKEEALAKSLKYNVHKNLGECLLAEGDIKAGLDRQRYKLDRKE